MPKAKKKKDNLEKFSDWAQYFTIASAILYGAYTVLVNLTKVENAITKNVSAGLLVATMAGGMLMGLLYLLRLTKKK